MFKTLLAATALTLAAVHPAAGKEEPSATEPAISLREATLPAPHTAAVSARSAAKAPSAKDLPDVPFTIALSAGPNFNLGGSHGAEWFGSRPAAAMQFDIMMNLRIINRWSAYLDLGITFFETRGGGRVNDAIGAVLGKLFSPVSRMKPSAGIGLAYTLPLGRWEIAPRAGAGIFGAGSQNKTKTADGTTVRFEKEISPLYVNAGVGAGYRLSRLCTLFLDTSYHCPVQRATAAYTVSRPDTPAETVTATSRSWAHDLSFSIGVKFHIGARKR